MPGALDKKLLVLPLANALGGTEPLYTVQGGLDKRTNPGQIATYVGAATGIFSIEIIIDGGGILITPGVKGDLEVPFAATIQAATLLGDIGGNLIVDVWKDSYGVYPPTIADTITGAFPPTLAGVIKSKDTTLTGWTTAIAAGDTLRFSVLGAPLAVTRATLALKCVRV